MDIDLKIIINIFTVIDSELYLLVKNNNELIEINCLDDLDKFCTNYIKKNIDILDLNLNQYYTFSEKKNSLNLKVLYIDIINLDNIKLNNKFKFVKLDKFNDNKYVIKSVEYLKQKIVLSSTIKKLYPEEFVLPEIQKLYENLFNKKYDRRNFRKKLIKLDIIEGLDKVSLKRNGRPAKLYKFKDMKDEIVLI